MAAGPLSSPTMPPPEVAVWDPFVRVFHWSLIVAFAVAYLTEDELLAVHVWAGYAVGGLLALRVVWGFVGPQHARFADFVCGPSAALKYLGDLVCFRAPRFIGHSPAGGAMVLALLLTLGAVVGTGLVTDAIRNNGGPLAGFLGGQSPQPPIADVAPSRQERGRQGPARIRKPGRAWKEAHELLANLVLVLAGLHVLGVLIASLAHHENLVRAMITGRKRVDPQA